MTKLHVFDMWMFPKIVGFAPKSSILIGVSIINHPFWGTTISGNTYVQFKLYEIANMDTSVTTGTDMLSYYV